MPTVDLVKPGGGHAYLSYEQASQLMASAIRFNLDIPDSLPVQSSI
jgi:hypothetical protein